MSEQLTLDQALQKGIEAHKAGKVQEADQYYTAILQAQPTHPDANHNMGVLAVSVGKVEQALPFFKKALEANSTVEQFWISYIDALIKIQKPDEAKAALAQAKDAGVNDKALNQLTLRVDSNPDEQTSNTQDPPQEQLKPLLEHYRNGNFKQALEVATDFLKQFPNSAVLYNIIGAVYASLKNYDEALRAYKNAIAANPNYSDPYNNMGNVLKEQGDFDKAAEAYQNAIIKDPNFAEAYYNKGISLYEQNKLNDAIISYEKAVALEPSAIE